MVLESISSLKVPAKIREYRKSQVIFDEGTTGVEMFIIYTGSVRLSTKEPGREITLAVIGPGEFFGEMAVIDSAFRTAHGNGGRGRHETRRAGPEEIP